MCTQQTLCLGHRDEKVYKPTVQCQASTPCIKPPNPCVCRAPQTLEQSKAIKQGSLILISSGQITWPPMKSFMSLYGREHRPGDFPVCCTYSSTSPHKEQRQHLDRSGPSCQLLLQLQHEPPNPTNTLSALLSSPLPSCTDRYTSSVWGTQASWARSQARWHNYELWQMLPLIPFLLQKQRVFQPSILQENLGVRFYFQCLLCFNFIFSLHSISSFLVWIKLSAHYVSGCATQTRIGNGLKAPWFQLWHWGNCT